MDTRGKLSIDPGTLAADSAEGEIEIVIPYTEWSVAEALLKRAPVLAAGLNARLTLIAVHTVPYPADFECPTAVHAHLVDQLVDLASHSQLPVTPHVVLARSRDEGLSFAMKPQSVVLVGTRKHFWRTSEESLARSLARDGHRVALVYVS